jgi:hypothetical protein
VTTGALLANTRLAQFLEKRMMPVKETTSMNVPRAFLETIITTEAGGWFGW